MTLPIGSVHSCGPHCPCGAKPIDGFQYRWAWAVRPLPSRKGQLCRVLCRGAMNSALVEFEDGYKVVTVPQRIEEGRWAPIEGLSRSSAGAQAAVTRCRTRGRTSAVTVERARRGRCSRLVSRPKRRRVMLSV